MLSLCICRYGRMCVKQWYLVWISVCLIVFSLANQPQMELLARPWSRTLWYSTYFNVFIIILWPWFFSALPFHVIHISLFFLLFFLLYIHIWMQFKSTLCTVNVNSNIRSIRTIWFKKLEVWFEQSLWSQQPKGKWSLWLIAPEFPRTKF